MYIKQNPTNLAIHFLFSKFFSSPFAIGANCPQNFGAIIKYWLPLKYHIFTCMTTITRFWWLTLCMQIHSG